MGFISIVGDFLLYFSFSLLIGSILLTFLPIEKRPEIAISNRFLLFVSIGIVLGMMMQPLQLVLVFYKEIGLWVAIKSVFLTFEVGKAWWLTVFCVSVGYIWGRRLFLSQQKEFKYAMLIGTLGIVLAVGWASHATTLVGIKGMLIHSLHFGAVTSWLGILFVSSWFSKPWFRWRAFLKWYTPVAVICLFVIIGTGIYLMKLVVSLQEYVSAWQLPYGQMLLLKHSLIIPLLLFALINGVFSRKKLMKNPDFQPIGWFRGESFVALCLFTVTASLGKSAPPHDIETTLSVEGPSHIFSFFYSGTLSDVGIGFTGYGVSFWLLTLLFGGITLLGYKKGMSWIFSFVFSLLCSATFYLGWMFNLG